MQPLIECPFREPSRQRDDDEIASCRLLQEVSGLFDSRLCEVRGDACEACCESHRPSVENLNPVVASLLYDLAGRVLTLGGAPGFSAERAARIEEWAEHHLDGARSDQLSGVAV